MKNFYLVHANCFLLWHDHSNLQYLKIFKRALSQQNLLQKKILFIHNNQRSSLYFSSKFTKKFPNIHSAKIPKYKEFDFVKTLSKYKFNDIIYLPSQVSNSSEKETLLRKINNLEYNIQVFIDNKFQIIDDLQGNIYQRFIKPPTEEVLYSNIGEYDKIELPELDSIKKFVWEKSKRKPPIPLSNSGYFDVSTFMNLSENTN